MFVGISPFWQEFLTEWPNVRFGAVAAVGENLWGRPLDWKLSTCGAGVLIIQDNPGKGKEGGMLSHPHPMTTPRDPVQPGWLYLDIPKSDTLTTWDSPTRQFLAACKKTRCKGRRSELKHCHSHSGAFILKEQIMLKERSIKVTLCHMKRTKPWASYAFCTFCSMILLPEKQLSHQSDLQALVAQKGWSKTPKYPVTQSHCMPNETAAVTDGAWLKTLN